MVPAGTHRPIVSLTATEVAVLAFAVVSELAAAVVVVDEEVVVDAVVVPAAAVVAAAVESVALVLTQHAPRPEHVSVAIVHGLK